MTLSLTVFLAVGFVLLVLLLATQSPAARDKRKTEIVRVPVHGVCVPYSDDRQLQITWTLYDWIPQDEYD